MVFSRLQFPVWGIKPGMSFLESQRIRLINIYTFIAVLSSILYGFFFLIRSPHSEAWILAISLLLSVTWIWNYHGKTSVARLWLYSLSFIYLVLLASTFGRDSGFQLIMILVLISGILLVEKPEWPAIIYLFGICSASFVFLEMTQYSLNSKPAFSRHIGLLYYVNLSMTLAGSLALAVFHGVNYAKKYRQKIWDLEMANEIESTIHYFSSSLFGKNTVDEILWDITKNCIGRLGFVDCVIYLLDEERQVLVQKAAFGNKNPREFEIYEPIEIQLGQGIVGAVAQTGQPELVTDTSRDSRYIADDAYRMSEIAVPMVYEGKVLGVIDSEHPETGFFTQRHLSILQTIASLGANKIIRSMAGEEKEKALKLQLEAEKIKAIDELKTKLFTNVSHELRTPLTLIIGTIDKNVSNAGQTDWDVLKRHTDRLLRLINQLLDLTKLESGSFTLHPRPGDISSLLRMIISLFCSAASSRNISIEDNIPLEPIWLNFDQDALEKICFNLISNAVKFSRNDSSVFVNFKYTDQLVLEITDQGMGIPVKDHAKIFERFYQVDDGSSGGSGIGLTITRELVDLHGGSIELSSTTGVGTTFRVTLPLLRAHPPVPQLDTPGDEDIDHEASVEKNTVLLVEDNHEISNLVVSILQPGYHIVQAFNGESGIEKAESILPDLIICDIMMPGISGLEVCDSLKNRMATNHIPIILLTAKAEMESKLEGLRKGADDYLIKPFNPEELMTRVQNLLSQRSILREKFQKIIELRPSEVVITNDEEVFVRDLMSLLEANMDNSEFEVNDICRIMGLSRMQLYRKVKALTNQSVAEFIRNQRLNRAAYLLKEGVLVSQAAYSVGYSSLSNFSKIFKEKFGVPPSEYHPS